MSVIALILALSAAGPGIAGATRCGSAKHTVVVRVQNDGSKPVTLPTRLVRFETVQFFLDKMVEGQWVPLELPDIHEEPPIGGHQCASVAPRGAVESAATNFGFPVFKWEPGKYRLRAELLRTPCSATHLELGQVLLTVTTTAGGASAIECAAWTN